MEILKKLNKELKEYLDTLSEVLTNNLISLLNGENITYLDGKPRSDIAAFNFEYLHDYLNITFFGTDKDGMIITKELKLPINDKKIMLLPDAIWDKINEIEANDEDDELEESLEEYNEEKNEIFESWFTDCWTAASEKFEDPVTAYFSMSEMDSGIELNSLDMVEIIKDKTNMRRYIE